MAKKPKANDANADVKYAFRVAHMLIDDVQTLLREYHNFRHGQVADDHDDFDEIPAGIPNGLQGIVLQIQHHQGTYEEFGARIRTALQAANIDSLSPIVYQSPFCGMSSVTGFEAIDCLSMIATESCARLVFNYDTDGKERTDMPPGGTAEFASECSECEKSMAAVTTEELARLEALLRIEELRTLAWLEKGWSIPRSPTDWLKVFEILNVKCRSISAFDDQRKKGLFRQHPDSTVRMVRLAFDCLPPTYSDQIVV